MTVYTWLMYPVIIIDGIIVNTFFLEELRWNNAALSALGIDLAVLVGFTIWDLMNSYKLSGNQYFLRA